MASLLLFPVPLTDPCFSRDRYADPLGPVRAHGHDLFHDRFGDLRGFDDNFVMHTQHDGIASFLEREHSIREKFPRERLYNVLGQLTAVRVNLAPSAFAVRPIGPKGVAEAI